MGAEWGSMQYGCGAPKPNGKKLCQRVGLRVRVSRSRVKCEVSGLVVELDTFGTFRPIGAHVPGAL